MDIRKIVLYFILTLLVIMLFNTWQRDYSLRKAKNLSQLTKQFATNVSDRSTIYISPTFVPGLTKSTKIVDMIAVKNKIQKKRLITVKTDVLEIKIDTQTGNIVSAKLLKYQSFLGKRNIPIQILSGQFSKLYIAQSGLVRKGKSIPVQFQSNRKSYILGNNENTLIVPLKGRAANGLLITKIYTFHRDDYAIRLVYHLKNNTTQLWKGSIYTQITCRQPSVDHRHFYVRNYNGASIGNSQIPYEKLSYELLNKKNVDRTNTDGWIAMQQHYFLTAWIPGNHTLAYHYYSHVIQTAASEPHIYIIGFVSPQLHIAAGNTVFTHFTLYVGPEIAKRLKSLSPKLERTIDYGWLWPVSMLLFWIMGTIHDLVRNWGWAIIITTILIKFMFYWFSAKSFRSMAHMREMQPQLQALKERHGDDRQVLSRMTIELYRKEKINPLGGCLPMLIQIPVFIAFYYVIIESVELRQAPFIWWIHDLSVKDPYYILPILMGGSMLLQQWLSPTSPDSAQQKMMWVLPIVFTVFFINFPAGLALYWITNNIVQASQQWYVNKTYESHKSKLKARHDRKK